jgi:ATP-dependent DNA helicase RecQ
MHTIAFIDLEIDNHNKIRDIGGITGDGIQFHKNSMGEFIEFVKDKEFICGHNIFKHDLKYLSELFSNSGVNIDNVIDTLYLSPLLFPLRPYHALDKDYKFDDNNENSPLNDSIITKELLIREINEFKKIPSDLMKIYYWLLNNTKEFSPFFKLINFHHKLENPNSYIRDFFANQICSNISLELEIENSPIALAYCLSHIYACSKFATHKSIHDGWVNKSFPEVDKIFNKLRNKPCVRGCVYCKSSMNIKGSLKKYFGYDEFRTYGSEPLQENAVTAAINGDSLLAIFPTGGGKSITFQLPALMSGDNVQGLTVVISPLQSLMKDQVDNLEKIGILDASTINGLLDPIERAESINRVINGDAKLLYISPESLRSKSIERILLDRNVVRFVIDEAHCFSSWGQDFRVDYLYIADFIKNIQLKKNLDTPIPVSCFTATAKQKVIFDIQEYFRNKLSLELKLFTSNVARTNLEYQVFENNNDEEKYQKLRELISDYDCPTIVYVSRTKLSNKLADRLINDGFDALPFHGKMESHEKNDNQNAFISGEVSIMVATSAFGMGVDKKDVGLVVHYEICDSLENYVQEAGRAGRDEKINANCFILFNENDLDKHFLLLNQTKITQKEIQQVWKAIKNLTQFRNKFSNSALEIARASGWDNNIAEIETRVKSAIAALEDAGYVQRNQNIPRIYANSILVNNVAEASEIIYSSKNIEIELKEKAVRVIKSLISKKRTKILIDDSGESRIDYISDTHGIAKREVIDIINFLKNEKIIADNKDLTAFLNRSENKNKSLKIFETFGRIEKFLIDKIIGFETETEIDLKYINEEVEAVGLKGVNIHKLKTIFDLWIINHWAKRKFSDYSKNHFLIQFEFENDVLKDKIQSRLVISRFILEYLFDKFINGEYLSESKMKSDVLVEFSVYDLKVKFNFHHSMFNKPATDIDIEGALYYLTRINAIKIEGGFLILYNKLQIQRLESNNYVQYKVEDYQKLNEFYQNKISQIHIVGEYAKRMVVDYKGALQFVDDYFKLNFDRFISKYFDRNRQKEIKKNLTPKKFQKLFGSLIPSQLSIINESHSKKMIVAAGPGSGKTKVLVHKLASLLILEDVKHEQLLMLTFSKAAAVEFKKRLVELIGSSAYYVEIKTFHSYCFDILGKVGNIQKSDEIIKFAIQQIENNEIEVNRITKTVLVIDEAQDMSESEYQLVVKLIERNDDLRIIAVGDDDQNIYEFRGSDSKYFSSFIKEKDSIKVELIENFRSNANLVSFTNSFVNQISYRLKSQSIVPIKRELGNLELYQYKSKFITIPVLTALKQTDLIGTTCVLTNTNEEARKLNGLLLKNNFHSKLIQSNDNFNLINLIEFREFMDCLRKSNDVFLITTENWEIAKNHVILKYKRSNWLRALLNFIQDFEKISGNRFYLSDIESFVGESKLEDFHHEKGETIIVSTIHKAKGREFDNVFILLQDFKLNSDQNKRLLYVGLTRAKHNLYIHSNIDIKNYFNLNGVKYEYDQNDYLEPDLITVQLNHKDIYLDYFISKQSNIKNLVSGDYLAFFSDDYLYYKNHRILKFSNFFKEKLYNTELKNYRIISAKVNFLIYWHKEGSKVEYLIILPELVFQKE